MKMIFRAYASKVNRTNEEKIKRRGVRLDLFFVYISFLLVSFSFQYVLALKKTDGPSLQCRFIHTIEQGYLSQHILYKDLDENLKNRLIDQYVKRLDPLKVYLLNSDVNEIKKEFSDIFNKLKQTVPDCSPLVKAQDLLVKRAKERADYATKMLGPKYKFDSKLEFKFDPDKTNFPETKKDAETFLSKYVHFQISNYLATDLKLEEAKNNVKKSWDRILKRLNDTPEDDLYSGYLDSFARALDPHSSFFSKDVWEDFDIQMSLSLEGIGATLSSPDGFTTVESLVPGGSAARSGMIEPQDKIMAVGQGDKGPLENVVEMELRDVVRKIRGPKGTKVRLSILRKKSDTTQRFTVTLVRDKVKLEDEAASILYQDKDVNGKQKKIGIVNFPSFYSSTKKGDRSSAADLKKLLNEAREKKVDGLVLDLSNNGGGSLDDAVKIAGLFFKIGNVVKQSSRDDKKAEHTLDDKDPAVDWKEPLVVLTSRFSASASEIVAGTLQDYKRAVIVGADHTFGKGSVQSVVGLPQNLGALKVTIGYYFIPGGNSTQHKGVEADIVLPGAFSTDEIGEKSLDYSLPPISILPFLSKEAYVAEGEGKWIQIQPQWISTLAQASKVRVDKNEEFKKVLEELKKNKDKGKIIKLSDSTKNKEKLDKAKATKNASKEDKNKEYLKRAEIQEAVAVLGDLIQLQTTGALAVAEGSLSGQNPKTELKEKENQK